MAKARKAPAKRKPAKPGARKRNKGGRPSTFTQAKVDAICERLAKGEPMAVICRDPGMPDPVTVTRWGETRPDVVQAIARAREAGFDHLAAQCLEIAEDGSADYVLSKTGPILDTEHVARSKLRIETRLKLLAKWDPKRYGDKLQLADADGGKLPPAPQFIVQPVIAVKSDE